MKNLKNLILFVTIIIAANIIADLIDIGNHHSVVIVLTIIFLLMITFRLVIRKNINFKKYFTSRYNIFSGKYRTELVYDMPIKLMYQKVNEVIEDSTLKLQYSNDEKFEIFAITTISWRSWGENVYIDFEEKNGKTKMKFCSVAILGVISWGKNEGNYSHLIRNIEESLII